MAAEGVAFTMFYKFHSVKGHFFYNLLTHTPSIAHKVAGSPLTTLPQKSLCFSGLAVQVLVVGLKRFQRTLVLNCEFPG